MGLVEFIIVLLVLGWFLGLLAFPAIGGVVHLLLVVALILVVYRLVTGKRL